MTVSQATKTRVIEALEKGFDDGIQGLYAAAWSKVAGGESLAETLKQFDAGLLLDAATLHEGIIAEAKKVLDTI